jgi:hypothetical protein
MIYDSLSKMLSLHGTFTLLGAQESITDVDRREQISYARNFFQDKGSTIITFW